MCALPVQTDKLIISTAANSISSSVVRKGEREVGGDRAITFAIGFLVGRFKF